MQPAPINPATGQPQIDPNTGQPAQPTQVFDDQTHLPLMQPSIDPVTGEQRRKLVIPDKSMWSADAWKEISIEDVVPSGDQLDSVWKALQTTIQILLQQQPDTGQPLFDSEILTEIIPGLPAQIREKMRQKIKLLKTMAYQQRQQQQQQSSQQQGKPPAESINYKDVGPDAKMQMLKQAGINVQSSDVGVPSAAPTNGNQGTPQ